MFEFWRFHQIDEQQYTLLQGSYNLYLIALSIIIASMAAYSCLIIVDRIWHSNAPKTIKLWKLFGSIVFGLGCWAMHFAGMLAFNTHHDMSYDISITMASLFPPMIGAFFSFKILYRQRFSFLDIQLGGLYLALGIGSMHFLGMEAMKMEVIMVYDFTWFITSIIIAHIFACIAIYLIKLQSHLDNISTNKRTLIASIMGISVASMHYTAMKAVSFYSLEPMVGHGVNTSNTHGIALVVAAFVVLIVSATILCSIVDARLQSADSSILASLTREQDIINNLADGLIIFDEHGVVESLNYKGWEMFESQQSDNETLNIKQLMPSFDLTAVTTNMFNFASQRNTMTIEAIKKNGQPFPVEVSVSTMSTLRDDKHLYNCVVRDISKRIELENQLRQAQKLESMGQLAAGIAHEINTPTQYVSDNTTFLKDAFQGCLNSLTEIQTLAKQKQVESSQNNSELNELATSIDAIVERNDMGFIAEEIPMALDQSLEGLSRISKIVRAMKSFSHSNNDEMQQVDIAEAIESTVTIARAEWRYVANVNTQFDPNLSAIPCYRDQLNQVILNFIINAAHAIEDKVYENAHTLGLITITTVLEEQWAVIKIKDNGAGIPEEIVERVFDPFFTTKKVGKGTGQGLSIAYSVIVELHKGKISVESQLGEGTEFTVKIPLTNALKESSNDTALAGTQNEHTAG
ncbi:MHYT domain-containing protein [Vibrio amylolyticus]|uniref:MHYT domain-containing protein n=1 Tax=Vibrio amylolyticus TaxID=2847292 RepID=UPI003552DF54